MTDPNLHALFIGTVANGATKFVPVPIRYGRIGLQIAWVDAVSAATITLELTSSQADVNAAGAAWEWEASGVAITGPTAAAADSTLVNIENCRQQRARLKIVATANCSFDIRDGTAGDASAGLP